VYGRERYLLYGIYVRENYESGNNNREKIVPDDFPVCVKRTMTRKRARALSVMVMVMKRMARVTVTRVGGDKESDGEGGEGGRWRRGLCPGRRERRRR
jgi:hypothetical protein